MLDVPISHTNSYLLKELKEGERIPLVSDVMFHTMLNNESRKKYVSYLLSLLLEKDFDEINNNIQFMKNEIDKKNYFESKKTVDLVCKIGNTIYDIEMNNNTTVSSLERNISYVFDLYKSKMIMGSKYNYQKTIQINLNNFVFQGNENTIETYHLKNEFGDNLTDKVTIIYIYLPKIKEKYYNKDKLSGLEKLLLTFNEEDSTEMNSIIRGDKIMSEYRKDSLDASSDSEVIGLYDRELHLQLLHNTAIYNAEQKGKIETAKNLLKNGASLSLVLDSTGLTRKDLDIPEDYKEEEIIGLYDKEKHLETLHNTAVYNAEQKGKKEANIETAKNLLKNGVSKEIIMKSTGLTEEELGLLS